jgi:hypothetical protein
VRVCEQRARFACRAIQEHEPQEAALDKVRLALGRAREERRNYEHLIAQLLVLRQSTESHTPLCSNSDGGNTVLAWHGTASADPIIPSLRYQPVG